MSAARNLDQDFQNLYITERTADGQITRYSHPPRQPVQPFKNEPVGAQAKAPVRKCEIEIPGKFKIEIETTGQAIQVKHGGKGVQMYQQQPHVYTSPDDSPVSSETPSPQGQMYGRQIDVSPHQQGRYYTSPPSNPPPSYRGNTYTSGANVPAYNQSSYTSPQQVDRSFTSSTSYTSPTNTAPLVDRTRTNDSFYASPPSSYYDEAEDYVPISTVPSKVSYGSAPAYGSQHGLPADYRASPPKSVMSQPSHIRVTHENYSKPTRTQSPVYTDQREYDISQHSLKPSTVPATTDLFPEGVRSRLLYTSPAPTAQSGYSQSRPTAPNTTTPNPIISRQPQNYTRPQQQTPSPQTLQQGSGFHPSPGSTPYKTPPSSNYYKPEKKHRSPSPDHKEAEVDALTSLLMQNMEAAADPDFFGMCAKCGKSIMGENTGCSALDKLYHIDCFVCNNCGACLGGQPFFAMESKPYCEMCYMDTLEKCSVCSKPITDRILRATGKPYHPGCFTCVVCGKSLDGIPFTVDATNQIHCIEDFHKKFAPRCCVCGHPIMPDSGQEETVRIVAMDKSFHVGCYRCEDCGLLLSSEAEGRGCYPLDDNILCKNCNAKRIQAMTTKMTTEL